MATDMDAEIARVRQQLIDKGVDPQEADELARLRVELGSRQIAQGTVTIGAETPVSNSAPLPFSRPRADAQPPPSSWSSAAKHNLSGGTLLNATPPQQHTPFDRNAAAPPAAPAAPAATRSATLTSLPAVTAPPAPATPPAPAAPPAPATPPAPAATTKLPATPPAVEPVPPAMLGSLLPAGSAESAAPPTDASSSPDAQTQDSSQQQEPQEEAVQDDAPPSPAEQMRDAFAAAKSMIEAVQGGVDPNAAGRLLAKLSRTDDGGLKRFAKKLPHAVEPATLKATRDVLQLCAAVLSGEADEASRTHLVKLAELLPPAD